MRASTYPAVWTLALLVAVGWSAPARAADENDTAFARDVAPILATRCGECHNDVDRRGGLDLLSRETLLAGGESGSALLPGEVEKSLLWQRVAADEMPPKHPLDAAEKETLRRWIAAGARWTGERLNRFAYTTAHRAGTDWWSLREPRRPALPAVRDMAWCRDPIDRFILAALEEQGLAPAHEASRAALIRRLSFDLCGLPPTPEEVQAFVADDAPDAYPRLVERLLGSPAYGERWSRHWLDVVRYGESDGFERNMPRAHAWRYRDWVIGAFNDDLPYDEFTRQQIAGDVLPGGSVAATGFLVAGIHNTVLPVLETAQLAARADEMEDIVAAVGQTFLGLTVQCGRCHDHKFDPISQSDYYRLVSALSGVQHGDRPFISPADDAELKRRKDALAAELAAVSARIVELERTARDKVRATRGENKFKAVAVEPISQWTFDDDARDRLGTLHGELRGGAKIQGGRLLLDGQGAYVVTAPLSRDVRARTLEAFVYLPTLDQGGGGVISIETLDGIIFDSIVFAERQPRKWMAGSNSFSRTLDLVAEEETTSDKEIVHMAIVYHDDGAITVYRHGSPYAESYRPATGGPFTYRAEKAHVLLGMRHTGGGRPFLHAHLEEARLYDRALTAEEIAASARSGPGVLGVSEAEMLATLTAEERSSREAWRKERAALEKQMAELPQAPLIYATSGKQPPDTRLLRRGMVTDPADVVAPGGVSALPAAEFGLSPNAAEAERRRKLAAWLSRQENPLFARVMVNRLWHHHFGVGLVETPSDFGFGGGRPSHPELLDYLAAELVAQGYSLKAIHRAIVNSATYRQAYAASEQAAAIDAGNRLLWRRTPSRLDAESLRDAMLAAAGELERNMGGPPYADVRTYHNNGTTYFEPVQALGPGLQRRTIYRFSPRGERSPLLDTFDCPDPSVATPRRQVTTTPLQALALLNDEFTLHVAERLAARVTREAGPDAPAQIDRAWRLTLGRAPTDKEARLAAELVERHGLSALARALFNAGEFVFIE